MYFRDAIAPRIRLMEISTWGINIVASCSLVSANCCIQGGHSEREREREIERERERKREREHSSLTKLLNFINLVKT